MRRATIGDVAKRAGVSKSTVSHVVNNTRFVMDETRAQVVQVIEELNYQPSQIARSLTAKRTYTVGLLITDVGNPFYHKIILAVEEVALEHNYSVFLFNASYDQERSLKYVRTMIRRRVDGIILMSSRMSDAILAEATRQGVPTVVLDWNEFAVEHAGSIAFDFERGVRQAVVHLRELGHERFAYVTASPELWTARIRQEIYLRALTEHGVQPDQVAIAAGDFTIEGGRRALHELMQKTPRATAIFAVNDLTALGLLFEARELGLAVPRDLSLVGVDDIALSSQMTPGLTTVSLPGEEIGKRAMTMVLELIDAGSDADLKADRFHQLIQTALVVRASTSTPAPRPDP